VKRIFLAFKSLKYFKHSYLAVIIGAALSTAVITGALIVGDSVRYSLKRISLERLGKTEYAVDSGEQFWTVALADRMSKKINRSCSAALLVKGIISVDGGSKRRSGIQVIGVDNKFWKLSRKQHSFPVLKPGDAVINQALAESLKIKKGDTILVRVEKPGVLPQDAPFAASDRLNVVLRLTVKKIAGADKMGNFSLRMKQIVPFTVFVSHSQLSGKIELSGQANILLIPGKAGENKQKSFFEEAFKKSWSLADSGLYLKKVPGRPEVELTSRRIFIKRAFVGAALKIRKPSKPIFSYFVNSMEHASSKTPYSILSTADNVIDPVSSLSDNGIIINSWLARDLGAGPGSKIRIKYYIINKTRKLETREKVFKVQKILPMAPQFVDRTLMPAFPGLSEAGSCQDWKPGIPIDLKKIRKKDERYWERYRGTPKAFITLKKAMELWRNQFGSLTAVRYPFSPGRINSAELIKKITHKLNGFAKPEQAGIHLISVRESALKGSRDSVDFGELFIGLSFFLVFGAIILTALLFKFVLEQRKKEVGTLYALGFSKKRIRWYFLKEGFLISLLGGVIGAAAGIVYNQLVLFALESVWSGAVAGGSYYPLIKIPTILLGLFSGVFTSFITIMLISGRMAKSEIQALQQPVIKEPKIMIKRVLSGVIAILLVVIAVIVFSTHPSDDKSAVPTFFAAGGLTLLLGILVSYLIFVYLTGKTTDSKITVRSISFQNIVRNRGRSLGIVIMLMCGIFMVTSVSVNRKDLVKNAHQRSSGTGGFSLYFETSLPVTADLNTVAGRKLIGLDEKIFEGVSFIPFRLKRGDDASCLNLNRINQPGILGIDPVFLAKRKAFTFVNMMKGFPGDWTLLERTSLKYEIPAVADQTVITWGFGKKVGDSLFFNNEIGVRLKVHLAAGIANSIFQGRIIISEDAFLKYFPSVSGFRVFLVDLPTSKKQDALLIKKIKSSLETTMMDYGINITSAAARLKMFNKVENTYLSIFLLLGGLGLLLGTIGIGVLVIRNVNERRAELAALRAMGFCIQSIIKMVFYEHIFLFALGFLWGGFAAALAVLPVFMSPGVSIPWGLLLTVFTLIIAAGILSVYSASRYALKGNMVEALNNE